MSVFACLYAVAEREGACFTNSILCWLGFASFSYIFCFGIFFLHFTSTALPFETEIIASNFHKFRYMCLSMCFCGCTHNSGKRANHCCASVGKSITIKRFLKQLHTKKSNKWFRRIFCFRFFVFLRCGVVSFVKLLTECCLFVKSILYRLSKEI